MENIGVKETVGFTYVTCIPVCVLNTGTLHFESVYP